MFIYIYILFYAISWIKFGCVVIHIDDNSDICVISLCIYAWVYRVFFFFL